MKPKKVRFHQRHWLFWPFHGPCVPQSINSHDRCNVQNSTTHTYNKASGISWVLIAIPSPRPESCPCLRSIEQGATKRSGADLWQSNQQRKSCLGDIKREMGGAFWPAFHTGRNTIQLPLTYRTSKQNLPCCRNNQTAPTDQLDTGHNGEQRECNHDTPHHKALD